MMNAKDISIYISYRLCFFSNTTVKCSMMATEKASKNSRKIEVPTDKATEFELGHTASDIQRRRVGSQQREREEAERLQQRERGKGKGEAIEATDGGDRGGKEQATEGGDTTE